MKRLLSNSLCAVLSILMLSLLALPHEALARQDSTPYSADKRIRTFVYDPNEVFKFTGYYLYQSSIELAPEEKVINIAMGNSLGWQITPAGHRLFIKPIAPDATTNMTIVTNKRTYLFELHAEDAVEGIDTEGLTFIARFVYPDDAGYGANFTQVNTSKLPDINNFPERYNFQYTVTGSRTATPLMVFDDGEFTYLQFKDKNATIPAIFMVGKFGDESLVNYRVTGPYIVIERVASQFTLRAGDEVACLFNERNPLKREEEPRKIKFLGLF